MISGINIAVWAWMAIYTYLLYTIVFFLYSRVTMTKKQVMLFIPAIFVWTLIETYFTCMPSSQFQMIMCNFFELSWLLPTVYLFTENFSLNLIRFSVVSWIANVFAAIALNIYNHNDYVLFSQKRLDEMSWTSIAVFALSVAVMVVLEYPLIKRLLPYKTHLVGKYRIAACMYLVFVVIDYIIEINAAADGEFVWRGTFKALSALCLIVFIVFLAALARKRRMASYKQQLESRIELINSEYENIVEKNRELYKVRHELNKQAEMLRATKGYVPEDVRSNMMKEAGEQVRKSFEGMSLSGNLMIDTMLEKIRRKMYGKSIVFETVLTPIRFSKQQEDNVLIVQEDMFSFAERFYDDCKGLRYSIRTKNRMIFIIMEIELDDAGAYKKQKFIDMIGDRMIFRQTFHRTYSMLSRHEGSIDYELGRDGISIGVMIDTVTKSYAR